MAPENKKAAWWRLESVWREFRRQFAIYAVFLTVAGLARCLIGDIEGFMGFIAWESVYLAVAAVPALVLAYQARDLQRPQQHGPAE